jgi:plastocyanin
MIKLFGSETRSLVSIGLLIATIGLLCSCSKSEDNMTDMNSNTKPVVDQAKPGANEVWIQNMTFNPATITVAAGTTIMWMNKDAVTHNVTSSTGLFSSGSLTSGGMFSYKFVTAGSFSYTCTIHPSMTASVTVN